MTRGPSGGWLDYEQTMYLLDQNTPTALVGGITWAETETTARIGTVEVSAPGGERERLRIVMRVSPLRLERFSVTYTTAAGWIRRLCVNMEHRPFSGTHKHRIVNGAEDAYEPDDIPWVPDDGPSISADAHESVFRAFVNECSIVIPPTFNWQSPLEGA